MKKIPNDLLKKMKEHIKKKDLVTPAILHGVSRRERDMRCEAMDMGSHGAKEMWGDDANKA